ncbi:MAG: AAA family ATPase [Clostridiales bacterium]|nr:AAA family ATPase [Clostridiales bacterium]
MGETIAVGSGKGGVGKTSIVAGVATCLAAMGYKVLAVDADIGLRNLDILLGMSDTTALDFGDVLRGDTELEKAIVRCGDLENLHLLNAPYTLEESYDAAFEGMMERAKKLYDFCFVDCAAGLGRSLKMAASAAGRAIVVTTLDKTSLRDAARAVERFDFYGVGEIGLIVNRVRPRLAARAQSPNIDDAIDVSRAQLLGIVPEDERVIISANLERPIILDNCNGAALAYYNIARRLIGEFVPLMRIKNQ